MSQCALLHTQGTQYEGVFL